MFVAIYTSPISVKGMSGRISDYRPIDYSHDSGTLIVGNQHYPQAFEVPDSFVWVDKASALIHPSGYAYSPEEVMGFAGRKANGFSVAPDDFDPFDCVNG
jgi:hypothetical protein